MTEEYAALEKAMKDAEPLPWAWEQCGEKEDCPVVGVIFEADDQPLAGRVEPYDADGVERDLQRWNIALEWGSGIDGTSPSGNADFAVLAVNSIPSLLKRVRELEGQGWQPIETLAARQIAATKPGTHLCVVGVSGVRFACRVCRVGGLNADLSKNPKWLEPCAPSEEALERLERNARERIGEAMADLRHAATFRLPKAPEESK